MDRTVKREFIDNWIADAYPDALTKLARNSGVPASSISKIRNGRVPKAKDQREDLAKALGVKEDDLFPVRQDRKGKAS